MPATTVRALSNRRQKEQEHVLGIEIRFVTDLEAKKIVADDTFTVLNNVHVDVDSVIEGDTYASNRQKIDSPLCTRHHTEEPLDVYEG